MPGSRVIYFYPVQMNCMVLGPGICHSANDEKDGGHFTFKVQINFLWLINKLVLFTKSQSKNESESFWQERKW